MHWMAASLLGFFLFGGGNYMMSYGLNFPYDLKIIGSTGYLIFILTIIPFHLFTLKKIHGYNPNCHPNSIYSSEHGLVPGFTVGIIGGMFIFLAHLSLLLGWFYDSKGASITFLLLAGISPVTSILSFFIYKEKFTPFQISGMIISLAGIGYLGYGSLEGTWISYFCGMFSLVFYSIRNLTARHLDVHGLDVYTAGMLNALGEFFVGVLFLVYVAFINGFNGLFVDKEMLATCLIGAILVAYGQFFVNQSVMTGNIGVVITIANSCGVLFIALDFIIKGAIPDLLRLAASLIVIFGVAVMLLGDQIFFRKNSRISTEVL
jgi:drug/metabolite transporter (DMT)-like permease